MTSAILRLWERHFLSYSSCRTLSRSVGTSPSQAPSLSTAEAKPSRTALHTMVTGPAAKESDAPPWRFQLGQTAKDAATSVKHASAQNFNALNDESGRACSGRAHKSAGIPVRCEVFQFVSLLTRLHVLHRPPTLAFVLIVELEQEFGDAHCQRIRRVALVHSHQSTE